jgi:hypothetical protein
MTDALTEICARAMQRKVRILVDAEQQSVQPGIDRIGLDLMRHYNRGGEAIVYNTYQAYLKSTPANLLSHMRLASQKEFTLGVKLVRGAYMNSEPPHLINDTKQDTDVSFNSIAEGILQQQSGDLRTERGRKFPSVDLFLATHNTDSALMAHQLHQSRTAAGVPTVSLQYGQLLGMADEVSCRLLQLKNTSSDVGPAVYKCLSWGTLSDCLSYLLRRAVENRDAVSRTQAEYIALKAEVRRRITAYFFRS